MKLPRFTTRLLMVVIGVLALLTWVAMSAHEVSNATEYHSHTSVTVEKGAVGLTAEGAVTPPLWPRFWRKLLGLKWQGLPLCGQRPGHFEDLCSRLHPEMHSPPDVNGASVVQWSEAQRALYQRLQTAKK